MKVTVERNGGMAAAVYQAPTIVESSALTKDQQEELAQLITSLKTDPATAHQNSGRMRDAMEFKIIIDEPNASTVYTHCDLDMPKAFAALLTWIVKHSPACRN